MTVVLISTLFIIATIPIFFAAVQPWIYSYYSFCMLSMYIICLWKRKTRASYFIATSWVKIAVGIFFAISLLMCLPLPLAVVSYLSPFRYKIIMSSRELTNTGIGWDTISYSSWEAFNWWIFLLSLVCLLVVTRNLCANRKTLKLVVLVMISTGIFEALYGLIQAMIPSMGVLWVDYLQDYNGYARGTYINRNHFAGFIEMIWPLALGYAMSLNGSEYTIKTALSTDRLNRQAVMALVIVILLLSLLFSHSRAGITGAVIGFIAFAFLTRSNNKKFGTRLSFLWIGSGFILVLYCLSIGINSVIERFLIIGSDSSRLDFWRDSIPMIKDHPFGIGLQNFETVFQIYNNSFISDKTVNFAHNDYLQLIIETGWIGFFALAGGYAIYLLRCARQIKIAVSHIDPLRHYLSIGSFSGLVSISFHSFFDFNLQIPANCVYFILLLAILHASLFPENLRPKNLPG